jgi:hypothetical protein
MIIEITFKTPDAVRYALSDFDDDDDQDKYEAFIEKFVRYGECITIRFDTDKQTAEVVPV